MSSPLRQSVSHESIINKKSPATHKRKRSRRLQGLEPDFDPRTRSDSELNRCIKQQQADDSDTEEERQTSSESEAESEAQEEQPANIMADLAELARLLQVAGLGRPPVSKYDGKSSVEQFLMKFEAAKRDLALDDAQAIKLLRESLEGEADFFFTHMMQTDITANRQTDLNEWKQRLTERFAKTYALQLSEMRARKMRKGETAAEYVDAVVRLGKTMNPPINDEQIVLTLHDNLLPKYKKILMTMDPDTPDKFKLKLSKAMAAGDEEESVMEKLTELLAKATTSSSTESKKETENKAAKETALVASNGNQFANREHDSRNRYDDQASGNNNYRGSFRGRGRGRGRGFYPQQRYNNYQQPSYGYRPPFFAHGNQGFQQQRWYSHQPQQQWDQSQAWNQWQPRTQYPQYRMIEPSRGSQQHSTYTVESPGPSSAPQQQQNDQSAGAREATYGFFPENY